MQIRKARPPLSLHGQLLWRDFFYCASTNNPNFDRMVGNPICVQIPWDKNVQALSKWANVNTLIFIISKTIAQNRLKHYLFCDYIPPEWYSNLEYIIFVVSGSNWLPVDRCNYDSVKERRMDTLYSATRRGVLSHSWRLVVILGRRNEGNAIVLFL